jgi:hypothetical protein
MLVLRLPMKETATSYGWQPQLYGINSHIEPIASGFQLRSWTRENKLPKEKQTWYVMLHTPMGWDSLARSKQREKNSRLETWNVKSKMRNSYF